MCAFHLISVIRLIAVQADLRLQAVSESCYSPLGRGQQASKAPGRLNWPQDRQRPDPWSASGAGLTRARARPLPWPHEFPDPGISHQFSGSSPDSGKSHRFPGSSPPSDTIEKPILHGLDLGLDEPWSRVVGQLES